MRHTDKNLSKISRDQLKNPFHIIAIIFLTFGMTLPSTVFSADRTNYRETCIVIPFDSDPGIDQSKVALLRSRFSLLMQQVEEYDVIPTYRVDTSLSQRHFNRRLYSSIQSASAAAGTMLGARRVIYGTVSRQDNTYFLTTTLFDVEKNKPLRQVRSKYKGSLDDFVRLAPIDNIATLMQRNFQSLEGDKVLDRQKPEKKIKQRPSPKKETTDSKGENWLWRSIRNTSQQTREFCARLKNNCPEYLKNTREYLRGRLEVGTRIISVSLIDDRKDTFLGSIDLLDVEQDYSPTKLYADWIFHPNFGIELTRGSVRASTVTRYDGHSDGDIELSGMILGVFGRKEFTIQTLRRDYVITPYAGLGMAFFSADFDHKGWWHNGFSGENLPEDAEQAYREWILQGAPEWPNGGYQRTMSLDNTRGLVLFGGLSTEVTERVSVEFYIRRTDVDVDVKYTMSSYGDVYRTTEATFPMDNMAYGFGIRYAF